MTDENTAISVERLSKQYNTGENRPLIAVNEVTFDIPQGAIVGLLGPNGAGKTTLIKCILGIIKPTSGNVRISGQSVFGSGGNVYQYVGSVLEGARNIYWRLTVKENVKYFLGINSTGAGNEYDIDRILSELELTQKADEPVRKLSRGMKQKTALACILVRNTPIVFLDEPTLGLDVEAAQSIRTTLKRMSSSQNRTIIICSHDMDVIQDTCNRVIIMDEADIVADNTVDGLIDVFRTQSYKIRLSGGVSNKVRRKMKSEFNINFITDNSSECAFEILVEDGEEIFELMKALENNELIPQGIEKTEPDLKEAFLQIVGSESDGTKELAEETVK